MHQLPGGETQNHLPRVIPALKSPRLFHCLYWVALTRSSNEGVNVCLWHKAYIPTPATNVRFWG
jgi:hypothetical protein